MAVAVDLNRSLPLLPLLLLLLTTSLLFQFGLATVSRRERCFHNREVRRGQGWRRRRLLCRTRRLRRARGVRERGRRCDGRGSVVCFRGEGPLLLRLPGGPAAQWRFAVRRRQALGLNRVPECRLWVPKFEAREGSVGQEDGHEAVQGCFLFLCFHLCSCPPPFLRLPPLFAATVATNNGTLSAAAFIRVFVILFALWAWVVVGHAG
mmetsp:Transcript_67489/g.132350  ORF Transcript_67489/g.132350 Transcript_67489/m.132350 type:complete len:207 (-) Transcript_67489:769-1389(-)